MRHLGKNLFERIPERLDVYRKTVPDGENECVWAEAGVVPYKLCDSHFDCTNCSFDIVMRGGNELIPRRISSSGGKLCTHRFYHHCHTWAQVEENAYIRIGIDDFGQNILGPIEKICLPLKDEKIGKKSIRIKARGSIVSLMPPVEGYVQEVNDDLINQPQLANKSPYGNGWLVLLRPTMLVKNLKKLFYGTAAIQWFDVEMYRLAALITSELNSRMDEKLGMTLPDGGLPDFAMLNELPPSITKRVLEQFFLYSHTKDKFKD
ncbi:MAG: glycine cleavage system protein H [Desulfobacterales bacterium]|jgi:glycine cleavage system H lipoate-binding protein